MPLGRLTKAEIKGLQRECNAFTRKYLRGLGPVQVDGVMGFATKRRIMTIKYYLGYGSNRDGTVTREFLNRMRAPHTARYFPKGMQGIGMARRKRQRVEAARIAAKKKAAQVNSTSKGFATFDGRTVAAWMVPILRKSRANGWRGTVTSGVRTPTYSTHLCYQMCGRPSCPGRCAGRNSNHNMLQHQGKPYGALDVSDYYNFGRIQTKIGSPLINRLGARDPVHFSKSGR